MHFESSLGNCNWEGYRVANESGKRTRDKWDGMSTETTEYTFRLSRTYGNVRVRDCAHCGERTKQRQAQDASGKWVERFRCQRVCGKGLTGAP
jgi:hypothetical protein